MIPLLYIPADWLKHEKIIRNTVPAMYEYLGCLNIVLLIISNP